MTIMSADTGRLAAAVGRQLRAIAARFTDLAKLNVSAKGRDLVHPEFYGLSATRGSASAVKERANKPDVAPEHANAQAYLPIGPSCC